VGELSVIYLVKQGLQELPEVKERERNIILEDLLNKAGMKGIESLSMTIKSYLSFLEKKGRNKKNLLKKNNKIRKNAIYVDIGEHGVFLPEKRVSEDDIFFVIEDARFAVALLNMARTDQFSFNEFLETYPSRFGNIQKRVTEIKKRH
jgi:hypothetical protein